MVGIMKIRLKLDNEISRVIRNYNAKIRRLEKLNIPNLILPTKITKKELIKTSSSTKEIRRRLKSLSRFSKKGAESPVTLPSGENVTKYQIKELKILARSAKSKITKEMFSFADITPKIRGVYSPRTYAEMGDSRYLNKLAYRRSLDRIKSPERYLDIKQQEERYRKILNRMTSNSRFKENYMKMLEDNAYFTGFKEDAPEKYEEIFDRIMNLTDENFVKLFNEEKVVQLVLYYYNLSKDNLMGGLVMNNIEVVFEEFYNNLDEILKGYENLNNTTYEDVKRAEKIKKENKKRKRPSYKKKA